MKIDFIGPSSAHFGGMSWPRPCEEFDEVNWRLRYGTPSRSDLYLAASVLSAYRELIVATEKHRRMVVRTLRASMTCKLGRQDEAPDET